MLIFVERAMLAQGLSPMIWGFQQLPDTMIEIDSTEKIDFEKKSVFSPKPIRCYRCQHLITTHQARIEVAGHHQHTFTNPTGLCFNIACFAEAIGCLTAGTPTDDFTWFRGFRWNYAVCGNCQVHLGWFYQALEGGEFYGLIVDRLLDQ